MPFTARRIIFKSYQARTFSINLSTDGQNPSHVTVKVYNTKKPKAEIVVGTGWYSDSRGYGGVSNNGVILTDPGAVAMCKATQVEDAAFAALVDWVVEQEQPVNGGQQYQWDRLRRGLQRWWLLSQQEHPTSFVMAEREQAARNNKKFAVGQTVRYVSRHGIESKVVTLTGERFDYSPVLGGGWRFSFPGVDAPQECFREIEVEEMAGVEG